MTIELHLRIVGVLLLALAAANLFLPAYSGWREETARLGRLARQVFWVHMMFIVLLLVLMGTLCAGFAELLVSPAPLARLALVGLAIFWGVRLAAQLLVYDPALWRGKRFETRVHAVCIALWTYFVAVFTAALWLPH